MTFPLWIFVASHMTPVVRFQRDNLPVTCRCWQVVSLVSVRGRDSLFDGNGLHFALMLVNCSRVKTSVLPVYTKCPVVEQWSPTPVGLSSLCVLYIQLFILPYTCTVRTNFLRIVPGMTFSFFFLLSIYPAGLC